MAIQWLHRFILEHQIAITPDAGIEKICSDTNAELIQRVGNIVTLYKRNEEKPVIKLP
ncbi:MAG: hypothetical protein O7D86_10360 [Proteobacteria bacterium]|nr:hypothetical protein [Pseudomonadota bacterium]